MVLHNNLAAFYAINNDVCVRGTHYKNKLRSYGTKRPRFCGSGSFSPKMRARTFIAILYESGGQQDAHYPASRIARMIIAPKWNLIARSAAHVLLMPSRTPAPHFNVQRRVPALWVFCGAFALVNESDLGGLSRDNAGQLLRIVVPRIKTYFFSGGGNANGIYLHYASSRDAPKDFATAITRIFNYSNVRGS